MRNKLWILPAVLAVALTGASQVAVGAESQPPGSNAARPNIVFIHTDDLSKNLVGHMSAVRTLRRNGVAFRNFSVADSLCCPSRAAMLTGRFPHNTGVRTNKNSSIGGHQAFVANGNPRRTYAVALDDAGYRTGLFGKYMNGYSITNNRVPTGWDEWHVGGKGAYSNVGGSYNITRVTHKGGAKNIGKSSYYLNDLLGRRARSMVDRAHAANQPFYLQISSFAPHARVGGNTSEPRFPPAYRDRPGHEFPGGDCGVKNGVRTKCGSLKVPRGTGFSEETYLKLDRDLRNRVRMMQSLNDQIIKIRKHLSSKGILDNTYFAFSSDNGFHLGEHGLLRGKGSAYDHDTHVPLIVKGPSVRAGAVRHQIVQSIDLYATFQQLAGLTPRASNGHGLINLLGDTTPANWREVGYFEHRKQITTASLEDDPDLADGDRASAAAASFVPGRHTYSAIRTDNWLYVRYYDVTRHELYDLRADPGQHTNVYSSHRDLVTNTLGPKLNELRSCGGGGVTCWQAGQM